MLIEILIERDPDSATDVTLFLDGEQIPARLIDYRHVDPGVGYLPSEWREERRDIETAGYSRAFTEAALRAHDMAASSPYIDYDLDAPTGEIVDGVDQSAPWTPPTAGDFTDPRED